LLFIVILICELGGTDFLLSKNLLWYQLGANIIAKVSYNGFALIFYFII